MVSKQFMQQILLIVQIVIMDTHKHVSAVEQVNICNLVIYVVEAQLYCVTYVMEVVHLMEAAVIGVVEMELCYVIAVVEVERKCLVVINLIVQDVAVQVDTLKGHQNIFNN